MTPDEPDVLDADVVPARVLTSYRSEIDRIGG